VALAAAGPAVTVDAPRDGSVTRARSTLVSGVAPVAPRGGYELLRVTVNGRATVPTYAPGRYGTEVALELGRNAISTQARLYGITGQRLGVVTSTTTVVTRRAGPGTGRLDPATAYLAAARIAARLCTGRTGCSSEASCFGVSPHRVDCPVARSTAAAPVTRCAVVVTVRLRADRVYLGTYGCTGRTGSQPRRFVRRGAGTARERVRVAANEATTENRYGVPRIDATTDRFLP